MIVAKRGQRLMTQDHVSHKPSAIADKEVFEGLCLPHFSFSLSIKLFSGREQFPVKQEKIRPCCARTVSH